MKKWGLSPEGYIWKGLGTEVRSTYFRVKHTLQRSDFELAPKASGRLTARCTRLVFTACSPKCSQFNKYSCCFGDGNAYWNSHYLLLLCKHSLWPLRCNYVMKFHCIHVYCPYDGILSWAVNANPFSHMLVWHIWWKKNGNLIEVMCVCPLTQHHGAAQRCSPIPRLLFKTSVRAWERGCWMHCHDRYFSMLVTLVCPMIIGRVMWLWRDDKPEKPPWQREPWL